jgi:hypothetical protein
LKNNGYYSFPFSYGNGTQATSTPTKVIALNPNLCNIYNWKNLNSFEELPVLPWLQKELSELERINGAAIIFS